MRTLGAYKPLANCKLDEVTGEKIAEFAAHRQSGGLQVSSINSSLRVLRRVLRLAVEWGALSACPKVNLLPGEKHRERVVSPEEEVRYLAAAHEPLEGWVWSAPTKSGHMESSSLKRQHRQTFERLAKEAEGDNQKPVRKFVLYSLRHTFLTRLGKSGCDVWTLARIAGHSNIRTSAQYVHPSEAVVLTAMSRLSGHRIGHNELPGN